MEDTAVTIPSDPTSPEVIPSSPQSPPFVQVLAPLSPSPSHSANSVATTLPDSPRAPRCSSEPNPLPVSRSRSPPPAVPIPPCVADSPESSSSSLFFRPSRRTHAESSSSSPFFRPSRRTPVAPADPPVAPCPSLPLPGVSACSASSADPSFWRNLRPPLHLSSVSACSAPSAQASSDRCPPLQLSCVSASSAAPQPDLLERFLLNPDIPRSPSPEPAPLLVNVIPFSLSTAWVPERCIINNARFKRGLFVKGRVNWPLTIPPFGTPLNDCLHYAVGECRRIIGEGRDFYIGATFDPYNRFWGWEGHKHHHTWRNMWVVCQSTNIGIRRLETEMIDADIGRAHPLCANKAPGGGGIPKVASPLTPYFVYIVDTLE